MYGRTLPCRRMNGIRISRRCVNTFALEVEHAKYAASYFPNLETTLDLYYGEKGKGDGDGNVTVI